MKMLLCVFSFLLIPMTVLGGQMKNDYSQRAVHFFQQLDKNHMGLVDEFYDKDVDFQDPVNKIHGSEAIKAYYKNMYNNVDEIRFEFQNTLTQDKTVVLFWKMFLKTPKLNSGREFAVEGSSVITFGGIQDKAIYHRDYFDMGDFIYERVPLLGGLIGWIKKSMAYQKHP